MNSGTYVSPANGINDDMLCRPVRLVEVVYPFVAGDTTAWQLGNLRGYRTFAKNAKADAGWNIALMHCFCIWAAQSVGNLQCMIPPERHTSAYSGLSKGELSQKTTQSRRECEEMCCPTDLVLSELLKFASFG